MITALTHACIWVLDQDVAYDFYANKLGFEIRTDAPMGPDFRWLTVGPKDQPNMEIILMLIKPGMMLDEETADLLRKLVKKGVLGAGVFESNDVFATYEELKSKGVEFQGPPEKKFYGIECIMTDPFGNWFSLTEHPKEEAK
ncbi:MAG TPA: VOC family protein [Verrucomicrobiae bacterium]|nr:VOC family protein [Verrucomicrobiae bacterium]